ncbi:unnamed protein product [Acanthoscelides obtectus]|uniref:Cyclic GMP-AMP synthase n=1 Tax=Acanthoscelides obtectus TaxID=200917 RepID=A0A9P0P1D3_ACAOB|nr:unnamed protein product [Acanthoscelides obtectus]CAK1639141.1 Cyclic GMP-AMP synthase [Acanthoscelides obtectus]
MQKINPLFKQMFERTFYGGSYYDGIKVGKPEEYDLDLVLNLPVLSKPVVEVGDKPGFVQVRIMEFDKFLNQPDQYKKYDKIKTLFDDRMYLSTENVLRWTEKIVTLALNDMGRTNSDRKGFKFNVELSDNETLVMYAIVAKSYPAFTLKLDSEDGRIKLDIDLVPCFQFKDNQWPRGQYRENPFPRQRDKFLVVPKKPRDTKNCDNIDRYWRLSFQEQERALITGPMTNTLKPAIRLLKKLRDHHKHSIASYHIKTVSLWQLLEVDAEKWRLPLSSVFMMMLRKYAETMNDKCIPYYWNKEFNMIGHYAEVTLKDIGNTLNNIIKTIDRYVDSDPFIVAKFLIGPAEIEELRMDPSILGKKYAPKKPQPLTQHGVNEPPPQSTTRTVETSAAKANTSTDTSSQWCRAS